VLLLLLPERRWRSLVRVIIDARLDRHGRLARSPNCGLLLLLCLLLPFNLNIS
jgi:hypothetical protein